jgi:hypothetical protein
LVITAQVSKRHFAKYKEEGYEPWKARKIPFDNANNKTWINYPYGHIDYGITNDDGKFIEFDGSISRVVHQWDRFDYMYTSWLDKQDWATDKQEYTNYKNQRLLQSDKVSSTSTGFNNIQNNHDNESAIDLSQIMHFYNQRTQRTDTGLDMSDPSLYETLNLHGNSSTATVIALASGYPVVVYQRFVGTLRKSGYTGHIILGVAPDITDASLQYLQYRKVTVKILSWVNCTYMKGPEDEDDIFKETTCADPYPDIKIRWSRFPLARDWLLECTSCTGPVLVTDARDALFQLDPFGPGSPSVTGLQVFQEHLNLSVYAPFTEMPIRVCKKVSYKGPMLCSGTTVGTRAAMIQYLNAMYEEMKVWIADEKCRFDFNGDDQAIHNHLYYSGQLPFAVSIVNRMGGIVNTIGHHAAQIAKQHFAYYEKKGLSKSEATQIPYDGANNQTWISTDVGVTNEVGQFIEFDGSLSRVIHQWDRFHAMYDKWLRQQPFVRDPIPDDWKPDEP